MLEPALGPPSAPGRVGGLDFGRRRIGIAISNPERTLASPYANYTRRGPEADARYFRQLVEKEQIVLFVVGLPVHWHGGPSELAHEARRFGQWLAEVTGLPVEWFDERYTTSEAEQVLRTAGLSRKRRASRIDMLAAQIMLSAYLESGGKSGTPPGSLYD